MAVEDIAKSRRNMVLIGLIMGMFFSSLEQTVVGTAMPTIIKELSGFAIFAWVTTAYMICSTTVIPLSGKLADLFGSRFIYLTGWIIFVIGSFLCATAVNMGQLIGYRAIQGIGGGLLMPMSQTIIGMLFTPAQRAKWQGVFGAIFGLSSIVGPFLGGLIVDHISWHWIFLINVPFGLVSTALIFIGMKSMGSPRGKNKKVHIDWLGIFTLIPGIVLLLYGLSLDHAKYAWTSSYSLFIFGVALALFLVFIPIEHRAADPIIDMSLFRSRVFNVAVGLGFLVGLGMFGAIMFVPMFMQGVLGVTPTQAGSTMTPMMIALIIASVLGGRLVLKLPYRTVMATGMVISALGFSLMSTMGIRTSPFTAYGFMMVLGFGMGLVMPLITIVVQNAFPREKLGTVTSATTFFRSIGSTIGTTLFNVIMNADIARNITAAMQTADPVTKAVLDRIGTDSNALYQLLINPAMLPLEGEAKVAVLDTLKEAWSASFSSVFLTELGFIVAGIVISLLIGNGRISRDDPGRRRHPDPAQEGSDRNSAQPA
ncbi:MFS transporter [Paenibacillus melissococcoides]|uniref:MFS transporter n=1 Tax=Paenibacillus melissococcoides TaxID=2912268 RepID=A0ABM9G085_9BACL|nr:MULTISPECIES: MDR family MFS transporter [Paenibacillus]MEB9897292.1 MDR family MFS transporter [Bacillus cereus]CAH8245005.1 MFS transporter [Paenibacillus melissococcoides]CAH8709619.1 MFS transporter [Paenibacillus melissococcoides]CAH8710345.1 MFS transporter [Paenibacillus melissococcoides]GIO78313.1 MFS transporter [Paenibacillus dendritiformis]